MLPRLLSSLAMLPLALALGACGDDKDGDGHGETGSPDQAGSVCEGPEDCYPDIDHSELAGEVECLDRVPSGYCTHQCESDDDCCAVEGECATELPQVCAPFESTGLNMCFLSCEGADISAAGYEDENEFCANQVSPWFICRSSGGGANNRKICVPADCGTGAWCGSDADCAAGLSCMGDYCAQVGCNGDADCPGGTSCVDNGGDNYCALDCASDADCGLCRPQDEGATCRDDLDFVDGGVSVCAV
jgi:hypothetical protein